MKVKVTAEYDLKPFQTPNFVLMKDAVEDESPKLPLAALDPESLEKLCDKFRDDIFEKAKKQPPPAAERAKPSYNQTPIDSR